MPLDPRTRARDRQHLNLTVGYAQAHGYMTPTTPTMQERIAPISFATPEPEPTTHLTRFADELLEFAFCYLRNRAYGRAMAFMRKSEWPPEPVYDTEDDNGVMFSHEHCSELWRKEDATD